MYCGLFLFKTLLSGSSSTLVSDIFRPAPYVLLIVKSTDFQWVMPLAELLHLGLKTAARDRLTDLAYRNNSRLGGVGRMKLSIL